MAVGSQRYQWTATTLSFAGTLLFFQRYNSDLDFNSPTSTEAQIYTNDQDLKIHLLPYALLSEKTGWLALLLLRSPCLDEQIQHRCHSCDNMMAKHSGVSPGPLLLKEKMGMESKKLQFCRMPFSVHSRMPLLYNKCELASICFLAENWSILLGLWIV